MTDVLLAIIQWTCAILGGLIVAGTLLSITPLSPWWARVWDFPRLQIAVLAPVLAVGYVLASLPGGFSSWNWVLVALLAATALWQLYRIRPYTPLGKKQVERSRAYDKPGVIRVVVSNVLTPNREFGRWQAVVGREHPDVIAAAEVDQWWCDRIDEAFGEEYPHSVKCPLDNLYGLAVWSRLPLEDGGVEFIVQDDIPSIHGKLTMADGTVVRFHCLHPRPPVPPEHGSSQPRDAELVIVGRRIGQFRDEGGGPTLVFGDLNDVAWSRSTDLFIKLSHLLDVRLGRGFYNTFSANSRIMRFPLDHVFISPEFRLVEMRVLDHVGSDHFPVSVTLSHEPDAERTQKPDRADAGEQREATARAEGVGADH